MAVIPQQFHWIILWFMLGLRSGLFDHLFLWSLCLCTWGLFSISIFSKILNLLLTSKFSLSTFFCLGVIFVLSFCSFLFGEVSIEVGGLIGDLLSFGLVLEDTFNWLCGG